MSAGPSSDSSKHQFAYRPALDGIRALAVAAVLAYHAGMPWARGGFLGVDAFFVLSGYLITSLLLSEWNAGGTIGLIAFWSRRARRLLPALFLMLLGVVFYAVAFAGPTEMGRIRGDAIATIAYVANWRPVFNGVSYFDQFSLPSPLRHTWSLAIEEQYYLIWPLLLLGLLKLRRFSPTRLPAGRHGLLGVTLAMAVGSAILMAALFRPEHDPSRVYYGTDTRAQALLIGAALAMLLLRTKPLSTRSTKWGLQIAAVACAIGIGWVWTHASGDETLLYRGGFLLLAMGVAVIIAVAAQAEAGAVGRVLSLRPLRALGLISYGVYLWHWPIYMMLTPGRTQMTGWDGYQLFFVRVLATLTIATLSYHLLEMPVRRGVSWGRKVTWMYAPSGALALAAIVVLVTRTPATPSVAGLAMERPPPPAASTEGPPPTLGPPVRVMMVADSEGQSMLPELKLLGGEQNLTIKDVIALGCGFLDLDEAADPAVAGPVVQLTKAQGDHCEEWHATWQAELASYQPDIVIWVFGPWDSYSFVANGELMQTGTQEWDDYFLAGLQKDLHLFTADGARFILVTYPFCRPPQWSLLPNGDDLEREAQGRIETVNRLYRRFAAEHPDKVVLADMNRFVCPEGKFTDISIDGVRLRQDGGHFTEAGSVPVARWLVPQIVEAAHDSSALAGVP
jgi:peptidoglycan/LPS O-acetylase OafA/YrhL